ncbi:MAG: short-chain dehydrogenase [Mycobacterium sp.]|jgi:NADP-dependent 3-hydroxy acid dehydrogenase YdfG|nr:short-chain dehydrogenase [Mycobacterium sp.]
MTSELVGCVALVTGASSGIGEATARSLSRLGAATVLVARRADRLEELAEELRTAGGRVLTVQADVTDQKQAAAAVERAVGECGRLDIVINNAGVLAMGPIASTPVEAWHGMISTNIEGLVFVTQATVPHLIRAAQDSPRRVTDLVNVSSTSARTQRSGTAVYSLTKSGVNAFSESLRQELIPSSVRVSVVEPGTVQTDLIAPPPGIPTPPATSSGVELLQPQDVADAIIYMVTRPRRVAINEILLRAGEQTW